MFGVNLRLFGKNPNPASRAGLIVKTSRNEEVIPVINGVFLLLSA